MSPSYVGREGQVRLLHDQIALYWVSANENTKLPMSNSWFLFELINKSMIEHLEATNLLNAPRKSRFLSHFTYDLNKLVHNVAVAIVEFELTEPKQAQALNSSLAFFLFDLLSIMDRGFVFGLVKTYYKEISSRCYTVSDLIHFKLDFLRIICSHEHFVALNLPFATPYTTLSAPCSPTPSVNSNNSQNSYLSSMGAADKALYADLSPEFRQQHFLAGLMLSELATVLEIS